MPDDEATTTPEVSQNPLSRLDFKDGLFVYSPPEETDDNRFWVRFAPAIVERLSEKRELVAEMALMIQPPKIETPALVSKEMARESFEANESLLGGVSPEGHVFKGLLEDIFSDPEADLEKIHQVFGKALAQDEPYVGISPADLREASGQKLQSIDKMLHGPETDPRMILVGRILLQTMYHYYEALRE